MVSKTIIQKNPCNKGKTHFLFLLLGRDGLRAWPQVAWSSEGGQLVRKLKLIWIRTMQPLSFPRMMSL